MGPRFSTLLFLFFLSFCVSGVGASEGAQGGSSASEDLALRLRGCTHLSESRLRKILRLELGTLAAEQRPGAIEVQVICFPDALVLSVTHDERPPLDKRIAQVPVDIPERSVALAASELISEAWRTDVSRASEPPPPSSPKPAAPPPTNKIHRVELPFVFVRYGEPGRLAWGGQLGVYREFSAGFEWGASFQTDYGMLQDESLTVEQLSLSLAPHLRARLFGPRVQLVLGVSAPFGWVSLRPETSVPGALEESLSAPWAALRAESSLAVPLSERLFLSAGGTASAVWLPVRGTIRDLGTGEDQVALEISGVVLGLFAGFGARF